MGDESGGEPPIGRQSILMVCDFFYPNHGGVENHIFHLSQCLMHRGHKVVVFTHAYGDRSGVRHLTGGLKVYHAPRLPFYNQNTLPTIFGSFALLRDILIREDITVVHAHQAFSVMGHEAVLHARTMGYTTVFTDHSLFGFADFSSIMTNKLLKFTLADVHHAICVSHTSKENTVLRACIPPARVSVIPNAVDTSQFVPDPSCRKQGTITVVVLSRLVYRKGMDLLVGLIPLACARWPHMDFVIAGDGPKRSIIEEMVESHGLGDRVEMVGMVAHEEACRVLRRGHVFLNTSLTEAFCMAIVEAASCGLLVVSTRVGGVPEVLPPHMLILSEPSAPDLLAGLEEAVGRLPSVSGLAFQFHEEVRRMYNWQDVAVRTERAYARAVATGIGDSLLGRLQRYHRCGLWAGKIFASVAVVDWLIWRYLEWSRPAGEIERAVDFPSAAAIDDLAGALAGAGWGEGEGEGGGGAGVGAEGGTARSRRPWRASPPPPARRSRASPSAPPGCPRRSTGT